MSISSNFLYELGIRLQLLRYLYPVLTLKQVTPKLMVARFQARPFNMSVVQVYVPTSDGTDEQVEQFYADLETTLDDILKKDIVIIFAGDWNAKVGSDNNGWERVMGNFGYGDKNDRGELLLEFALEHDMIDMILI